MLKGQAEQKKREKALKTFNTLLKYKEEKVLFPWQHILWYFCWSNLPKRTFPVRYASEVKDNYRDPFPQLGAFVDFLLDVCKCSDVTELLEINVSIDDRMSSEKNVGTCCRPNVCEGLVCCGFFALLYEYGPRCQQKLKS